MIDYLIYIEKKFIISTYIKVLENDNKLKINIKLVGIFILCFN